MPCCAECLGRNSIAKAAAAAGPAVVNICVTEGEPQFVELFWCICLNGELFKYFFAGLYGPMLAKSIGSGTIIDPDGTILTCAHCVADIANMKRVSKGKVSVLTYNSVRTYSLIHFDEEICRNGMMTKNFEFATVIS